MVQWVKSDRLSLAPGILWGLPCSPSQSHLLHSSPPNPAMDPACLSSQHASHSMGNLVLSPPRLFLLPLKSGPQLSSYVRFLAKYSAHKSHSVLLGWKEGCPEKSVTCGHVTDTLMGNSPRVLSKVRLTKYSEYYSFCNSFIHTTKMEIKLQ